LYHFTFYIIFGERQAINLRDKKLKNNVNKFFKWNLISGAILLGVGELIRVLARRMHVRDEG